MNPKSEHKLTSVKDILHSQLNSFAGDRFTASWSIQKKWNSIAGSVITQHSKILYQKKDLLYIAVENSTWLNEMIFIKDTLIKKINEAIKPSMIRDIKFRIQPQKN